MLFQEETNDRGYAKRCYANDNRAVYIVTSSYGHDVYNEFVQKYERLPSSRWLNKKMRFKRIS